MNLEATFDTAKKIERLCATSTALLDLPEQLPPLPELITLFEQAIQSRQSQQTGYPLSGDYVENQRKIEILQHRLALLQQLNTVQNPSNPPHQPLKPAQNPLESRQNPSESHSKPAEKPALDGRTPASSTPEATRPPNAPKRGPLGQIDHLPAEIQDQILALLDQNDDYKTISNHLAKPPPASLGLKISEHVLKRFHQRHKILRKQIDFENLNQTAREVLQNAAAHSDEALTLVTNRLIKLRILEAATSPKYGAESLGRLHQTLNRIRLADLAERRVALAEQRQPTKAAKP